MIAWSTVAPALRELLSSLATATPIDPTFEGDWTDRRAEYIHPAVQKELVLRITRVAEFSADRVYTETQIPTADGPVTVMTESIVGMKEFTLEVRVESHEHSEEVDRWAWSMAERIRTGLYFQRAIDALLAVNVGLVRLGDARDISFTFDKRRVNAAYFEATFNAAFCLTDSVTTDWFERVELTSHIKNPGDTELSSPPNVTALVVPPWPDE